MAGVVLGQAWPISAFRRPDAPWALPESQAGIGQARLEFEVHHVGIHQRLERMRQRPAEQFHRTPVDERPQHRRATA